MLWGGGLLFLLGLSNWRYGVFGALLLAVFEGALRKWVLPEASQAVYFAKDFLLLGAYVRYFLWESRRSAGGFGPALNSLMACAVVWTFLESFNPGTGSIIAGLFGWKAYVMYMPLAFMVPALFRSEPEFERCLRYYVALALPVGLLAVAQFYARPESPLNAYAPGVGSADDASHIAVFGEDSFVRVTGTFSYISGYGTYLVTTLALLIPLLAWSKVRLWRAHFGVTLAVMDGNAMMTGSRATALGAAVVVGGFIFLTLATGTVGERRGAWVQVLAGAAAAIACVFFFGKALTALEQRTGGSLDEAQGRILGPITEPWEFMGTGGLVGYGDGISQPSVNALRSVLGLPAPVFAYSSPTDAENSRVVMELGAPGFFLWYGMRVGLVIALWRARKGLRSPFLRQLALGAVLVLFFQFFAPTMFAITANLYHWFLAGFTLLLPKLDRSASTLAAVGSEGRRTRRYQKAVVPELAPKHVPAGPS